MINFKRFFKDLLSSDEQVSIFGLNKKKEILILVDAEVDDLTPTVYYRLHPYSRITIKFDKCKRSFDGAWRLKKVCKLYKKYRNEDNIKITFSAKLTIVNDEIVEVDNFLS